MNLVEAIDAWIDEQIDDLSDDELETILEILDVVSASPFAHLETVNVYDEDIDELVDLAGGNDDDRAHTESVLRDALFVESSPDEDLPESTFDSDDEEDLPDTPLDSDDEEDLADTISESGDDEPSDTRITSEDGKPSDTPLGSDEDELHDTALDSDEDELHDTALDSEEDELHDTALDSEDDELPDTTLEHDDGFLSDLADAEEADRLDEIDETGHTGFLADLVSASTPASTDPRSGRDISPVELVDFDELGPSFLPESAGPSPRGRRGNVRHVVLPVFMIVGLAAFAFGMLQLLDSLSADESVVASGEVQAASTVAPTATAQPTAAPTADVTPEPFDPSAPTPTPAPEPTPLPRIGVRLINGDVMLVTYDEVGVPPTFSRLYDASDDDLSPARNIAWLSSGLGVINEDGDVLVVDPDAQRPEATVIYEANDGIEAAIKISSVPGQVAVLTESGDINLTPDDERADPDSIDTVWDAEEQGAKATDLSSIGDLVPFVLDDGAARMIRTSSENSVITIWLAGGQPPAYNIAGSPTGILMGIGQGAVARYRLGDVEGDRLESVWDPFSTDELPAIGYSSAGDRTAVVLGDGAIVLADDTGTGARIWDPSETELRAFVAVADDSQIVVLLETGSVVRIPFDPDELIESIWDITDVTLSPANQLVVEPADR